MGSLISIGLTGLAAQQANLATTGNNVANANTEGFSRQRVELASAPSTLAGVGFIGSGVTIADITRISDEFLVEQLRVDTANFNASDALEFNLAQIDSLLADPTTGLAPVLQTFFDAVQTAANNPASIPERSLLIAQAETLVNGFETLNTRLLDQNTTLNANLGSLVAQVNSIADGVNALNQAIVVSEATTTGSPDSALLDERDQLLLELSEIVSVTVVELPTGSFDVFIGDGQPLVVGNLTNTLTVVEGADDPAREDIVLTNNGLQQDVTDFLSGGEIGGILEFRDDALDPALNALGQIAIALADNFNEVNQLGIDLENNFGGLIFNDINERERTLSRVFPNANNALPNDRIISVEIEDSGELISSEYSIDFDGATDFAFTVTRLSDGAQVFSGTLPSTLPLTVNFDGLDVVFEEGSFQSGDSFLVSPTRFAGNEIEVEIERPEELALALPVRSFGDIGNTGTASITQGEILAIENPISNQILPTFATPGELTPPLVVRFITDTVYEVLDNSDPANPVPLSPPLSNQTFSPGLVNSLFTEDPGATFVTTAGTDVQQAIFSPVPGPTVNGVGAQTVTIQNTDLETGVITSQPPVTIPANTSAENAAAILNQLAGVSASATTVVQLTNFIDDGTDPGLSIDINGVNITIPAPDAFDPSNVADAINADPDLIQANFFAQSDGTTLTLTNFDGIDVNVVVNGTAGDSVDVLTDRPQVVAATAGTTLDINGIAGSVVIPQSIQFDNIIDDGIGAPLTIDINGQTIAAPNATALAAAINADPVLSAAPNNFSATTDGISVTLDNPNGVALNLVVNGSAGDSLDIISDRLSLPQGQQVTVGGSLDVDLIGGTILSADNNNLFTVTPPALSTFLGFQFDISGIPQQGDQFFIEFNEDGSSDNRNALSLGALQNIGTIGGDVSTFNEAYSGIVEFVGNATAVAQIDEQANQTLLDQSTAAVQSVSGVNLDEEAGNLIRFQAAFNANAQVIGIANDLFDTLLGILA